MKSLLITIIFIISFFSYSQKRNEIQTFQGEIFIKLIDVRNLISNLSDDKLEKFIENSINEDQTNYSQSEKKSSDYFKILIKNDLLKKPFFKLKMKSGNIINDTQIN